MESAEVHEIAQTVENLIASTRQDSIVWTEANPSTFVWNKDGSSARIVVQQISDGVHVYKSKIIGEPAYQLQAIDTATRNTAFSVNSDEVQELREKLKTLFATIKTSVDRKGISFLKSIVP